MQVSYEIKTWTLKSLKKVSKGMQQFILNALDQQTHKNSVIFYKASF